MPLVVIVVVSNVLQIFAQYYVNRVNAVSSPNSVTVILVFEL